MNDAIYKSIFVASRTVIYVRQYTKTCELKITALKRYANHNYVSI